MEFDLKKTVICPWCEEPILKGQFKDKSNSGDLMHFECAVEADEPNEE